MAISSHAQQLKQLTALLEQHREAIRNVLGSPPTGMGTSRSTEMKRSFTTTDAERVAKTLDVPLEQAEEICQAWPIYQLGFEDGQTTQTT